mgnify:CR=1 FL=1
MVKTFESDFAAISSKFQIIRLLTLGLNTLLTALAQRVNTCFRLNAGDARRRCEAAGGGDFISRQIWAGQFPMMQSFRFGRIATVLVAYLVLAIVSAHQAGAESRWQIVELSGTAQVVQPGVTPVALTSGDALEPGQKISTGPNGRVVLRRGESVITVSPNSRMGLPTQKEGGLATRILHSIGTLLFKVEKRTEQHFEVQTPFMAAVVKGTTFTTSVDAGGGAVHVVSGLVEVSDPRSGQMSMLRPGQTAITSARGGGLRLLGGDAPAGNVGAGQQADAGGDPDGRFDDADGTGALEAGTGQTDGGGNDGSPVLPDDASDNGTTIAASIGRSTIDVADATNGLVRDGRPQPNRRASDRRDEGADTQGRGRRGNEVAPGLTQGQVQAERVAAVNTQRGRSAGVPGNGNGGGPPSGSPGTGNGGGPPSGSPGNGNAGGPPSGSPGNGNAGGPPSGSPGNDKAGGPPRGVAGNGNGGGPQGG